VAAARRAASRPAPAPRLGEDGDVKIAVTGASGLIGSALVPRLRAGGHEVLRLVRRPPGAPDEVRWDPPSQYVDVSRLAGVDGVVHLAGAGIGDHRWTGSWRRSILESRTSGTTAVASALAGLDPRPGVLVSGSGIGYYGSDRGEEELTEDSSGGPGFVADVVRAWEASTAPAEEAGIRVAHARSGVVMSSAGGAYARMQLLFKLGLGGRLGSGRQYWSWITREDEVRALIHLLEHELSGPVNLTAPQPVRNADFTRSLGRALHRPTVLPVPALALRTVLGGLSSEVLGSQYVVPRKLLDAGFTFTHPDVDSATAWLAQGN
jgi:uncharacterized protein